MPPAVLDASREQDPATFHSSDLVENVFQIVCAIAGHSVSSGDLWRELVDGKVYSDLLHRIDKDYFKGSLIPGQGSNGVLKAAQLKRMYLRVIAFAKDPLGEDWSELPVPDFNSLSRPGEHTQHQRETLFLFSLILVLLALNVEHLKVEIECLLTLLPTSAQKSLSAALKKVPCADPLCLDLQLRVRVSRSVPFSKPAPEFYSDYTDSGPVDYDLALPNSPNLTDRTMEGEMEFKALQVLFEAVSSEAEVLRDQLVAASHRREIADARATLYCGELADLKDSHALLQENITALKPQLVEKDAEIAALREEVSSANQASSVFLDQLKTYDQNIASLDDVKSLIEQRGKEHEAALQALQHRCEEAELGRDVLLERERMLEEMRDEKAEASLSVEHEALVLARAQNENLMEELKKVSEEREHIFLRMTQKEDEVMQLAGERTRLEQLYKLSENTAVECGQKIKQLEEKLSCVLVELEDERRQKSKLAVERDGLVEESSKLKGQLEVKSSEVSEISQGFSLVCASFDKKIDKIASVARNRQRKLAEIASHQKCTLMLVSKLKAENAIAKTDRFRVVRRLQKEKARFCTIQCAYKEALARLEMLAGEIDGVTEENKALAQNNEQLEQIIGSSGDLIASLETEIQQVKSTKVDEEALARSREHSRSIQSLKEELADLEEKLSKLEEQKSAAEMAHGRKVEQCAAKITSLEGELAKRMEELSLKTNSLDECEKNVYALQRELQALHGQHSDQIASLQAENRQIQSEVSSRTFESRKALHEFHEQLAMLQSELSSTKEQFHEARLVESQLRKELEGKERLVRELNDQISSQQNDQLEYKRLSDILAIEALEKATAIKRADEQGFAAEILRQKLARQDKSILGMSETINQLEIEIDRLTRECAELEEALAGQAEAAREAESKQESSYSLQQEERSSWQQMQDRKLQKLIIEASRKLAQVERAVETGPDLSTTFDAGIEVNAIEVYRRDSLVETEMLGEDQQALTNKDNEIARIRSDMKNLMHSIKDEHENILHAWHSIGSQVYRKSLYATTTL